MRLFLTQTLIMLADSLVHILYGGSQTRSATRRRISAISSTNRCWSLRAFRTPTRSSPSRPLGGVIRRRLVATFLHQRKAPA